MDQTSNVTIDLWFNAGVALFATVIGGIISLCGTLWAHYLERKAVKETLREEEALRAFRTLEKLLRSANYILGISRDIDKEYEEARNSGRLSADICQNVRPLIGASFDPDKIQIDEVAFLGRRKASNLQSEVGNSELITRMWEIQDQAKAISSQIQKYNDLKFEHMAFMETCASSVTNMDSEGANVTLSGSNAIIATMKMGTMNSLLGQVIVDLDKSKGHVKEIVNRYEKACQKEFGDLFLRSRVSWEQ